MGKERLWLADEPRMRFFFFSITRKVTFPYGNFQWDKHMTIRRGQDRDFSEDVPTLPS
jgi:hypothetical protein